MADDKEISSKPVNDEALDALLAQWAEAELEPPVGFHERTMERLRQEQRTASENKKKRNVISLFVKKKKWMSAAAAAVLVLCCIPVVQAQFGHDVTQSANDGLMTQQKQIDDTMAAEGMESSEAVAQDRSAQQEASAEQTDKAKKMVPVKSEAQQPQQQTVQEPLGANQAETVFSDSNDGFHVGATQTPSATSADPDDGIAAYSLEEGLEMADNALEKGMQTNRNVTESLEQLQKQAQFYQEALDDVMDTMEDLQKELDSYDEKLKSDPENPELQAKVKELQQQMDTLKKELEELQSLVDEARAKLAE